MIPAFFIFSASGILNVLTTIFLANTVDYGEWKNHRRDESVIFSLQTFVVKLASGIAAQGGFIACMGMPRKRMPGEQNKTDVSPFCTVNKRMNNAIY